MTGILTINRSMTAKHLLSAAYIDCAALGLCFLMPWTPEFTGYQLPVGLMGYANVSAFASGEGDRVIDMAVAVPAMLIYLFPVFLVVTAALATAIATSSSADCSRSPVWSWWCCSFRTRGTMAPWVSISRCSWAWP
jgi:hypothetical protein